MSRTYTKQVPTTEELIALRDQPLNEQPSPLPEEPGILEKVILAGKYSVVGEAMNAIARQSGMDMVNREPDESFSVNDHILSQPGFLDDHPYLRDDLRSGAMSAIRNIDQFNYYVWDRQKDAEDWQKLDRMGVMSKLMFSLPTQVADAMIFNYAAKAVGAGGLLKATRDSLKSATGLRRAALAASLGASGNVAQELGIIALNPNRERNNYEEVAAAGITGALFAGGGSLLLSGLRKGANMLPASRIKYADNQMADLVNNAIDRVPGLRQKLPEMRSVEQDGLSSIADTMRTAKAVEGNVTLTVLRTPQTNAKIAELQKTLGDRLVLGTHELQNMYDMYSDAVQLEKYLGFQENVPVGGKVAETMQAVAPGARGARAGAASARSLTRTLLDVVTPTRASVDDPIGNNILVNAEGIGDQFRQRIDVLVHNIEDARSQIRKGDTFIDLDGTTYDLSNREQFGKALHWYRVRMDENGRLGRPIPDAPQSLRQAAAKVNDYYTSMADDARKGLGVRVPQSDVHIPHQPYAKQWELQGEDARARLFQAAKDNRVRDFYTGADINPDERALIPDVLLHKKFDPDGQIARMIPEGETAGRLNERWLRETFGDELYDSYLKAVDEWNDARANTTRRRYAGLDDFIDDGNEMPTFAGRKLEINLSEFKGLYEDNEFVILDRYHQNTGMNLAARMAIKNNIDELGPLVLDLTGKDLAKSNYNPRLLLQAVLEEYDKYRKMAIEQGKEDLAKSIINQKNAMHRMLGSWVDTFLGHGLEPSKDVPSALWQFTGKVLMRGSFMANLGGVLASQLPDLGGLTIYKGVSKKIIKQTAKMIDYLKNAPAKQLQAFHVATSDMLNNQRFNALALDYDIHPGIYGYGKVGRALEAVDRITRNASQKFSWLTGMKWWNSHIKQFAATLQIQDLVLGARKMVELDKYVKSGMTLDAALEKVGLTKLEAARYNRLGFNAKTSEKFLDHMAEKAVDYEGNAPWRAEGYAQPQSREAFLKYAEDNAVFPEMHLLAQVDRKLYNTIASAVNSETLNVIPEPKLGSRPISEKYTLFRMFHQFQSFAFSWSGQLVPEMAQHPAGVRYQYLMSAVALGALSEALHQSLTGRRSLEEQAKLWTTNPLAMIYSAADRGGLYGWLARPMAAAQRSLPWKIAPDASNMAFRSRSLFGLLGPSFDYADRLFKLATGDIAQAPKIAPLRNLIWLNAMNRSFELMRIRNPLGSGYGLHWPDVFQSKTRQQELKRESP